MGWDQGEEERRNSNNILSHMEVLKTVSSIVLRLWINLPANQPPLQRHTTYFHLFLGRV